MKQIIHINQHHIKWNRKHNDQPAKPVITCKTYKDNQYHHGIKLMDNDGNVIGRVKYQPDNPLACGAHVWIQTTGTVEVDGKAINKKERD